MVQTKLEMKPKTYLKGTSFGRLYIDIGNPEFFKWFVKEIKKLTTSNRSL